MFWGRGFETTAAFSASIYLQTHICCFRAPYEGGGTSCGSEQRGHRYFITRQMLIRMSAIHKRATPQTTAPQAHPRRAARQTANTHTTAHTQTPHAHQNDKHNKHNAAHHRAATTRRKQRATRDTQPQGTKRRKQHARPTDTKHHPLPQNRQAKRPSSQATLGTLHTNHPLRNTHT